MTECWPDLVLAALLGFALGVLWQEFHFRKITAACDEGRRAHGPYRGQAMTDYLPGAGRARSGGRTCCTKASHAALSDIAIILARIKTPATAD